jgi:hypothetical protein
MDYLGSCIIRSMKSASATLTEHRAYSLLALSLVALLLALCCAGCLGSKTGEVSANNVYDEMLTCDVVEFAEAADARYESEWRKLDDGLELKGEEEGILVRCYLGRYFDDDGAPYKLTFSKTVYVPLPDGGILQVKKSEVYSGKTGALREEDTTYRRSDPKDGDIRDDPYRNEYPYTYINAEEAEAELESSGVSELVDRLMSSPSGYFVDLYLGCMESSFSAGDLGMFEDRREQASQ